MAKIVQQTIAITVSKLVKTGDETPEMVSATLVGQLEQLVGELIEGELVVEATLIQD
jgi:hypothetical protein